MKSIDGELAKRLREAGHPMVDRPEIRRQLLLLAETDPIQFNLWRNHPVTELFLRYLHHSRIEALLNLMAQWESGGLVLSEEHALRGRLQALHDAAETQLTDIRGHYEGVYPPGMPWPEDRKKDGD